MDLNRVDAPLNRVPPYSTGTSTVTYRTSTK
eukprot:SAG31_NODE_11453_length_1028_cov_1.367061_1_plen_30_part_10